MRIKAVLSPATTRPAVMPSAPSQRSPLSVRALRAVPQVVGVFAVAMGASALVGWAGDIPVLKSWSLESATLKPNTALAFLLLGAGLLASLRESSRTRDWRHSISQAAAFLVNVIAVLTLFQYVTGLNLGIDQALFAQDRNLIGVVHPGRMASMTALCLLLLGVALQHLDWEPRRGFRPAQFLALIASVIGLAELLAFVYYSGPLSLSGFTGMSVNTAATLLVCSLGVLLARPGRGLTEVLFAGSFGGTLLRRFLLAAVVASPALTLGRLAGEQAGLFHPAVGAALVAVANVVVYAWILYITGGAMGREENRRRQAEAAMQRMAIIVEASDDAIIHNDLESNVLTWNRGATALFGYTAQEVLGRPTPMIPPGRQEERQRLRERIVQGGRWEQYEMELLHKDGRRLDASLTMSPVRNEQGEVVGAATIIRDITERKRAEQALRSVTDRLNLALESAHIGTFDWEISTGRLTWDRYTYPLFGVDPDTFLLNYDTAMNSLHPEDRPQVERDIGAAVTGSGQFESEFRVIWPDGSLHVLCSRGHVSRDPSGNAVRMTGVNWDVTRSRQAEVDIRNLNHELEARLAELGISNRELEAFSYSVSHDLRAPLRQVHGFSKVVVEQYGPQLDAQGQHYLRRIEEGASQMGRLIDDLLNLARLGRRPLKREPTELAALVEGVRADLESEINGRKVEWRIQPLPPADCDPGLMKQVFANLLANSLKYTRPRERAVIEVGQRAVNGEQAIYVRDNGVGFNMKYADKLFGVFQRLHRSDEFEGTGVGLATVQRIIHKHGGRIWAQGEVGKGATFSFTLEEQDRTQPEEQTVEEAMQ